MRGRWLLVAVLLLPVVEIAVIIQVGQLIGAWSTVAVLLAISVLGAWVVKHEGRRAWLELRTTIDSGQPPGRELTDAALILVGGTLLLTPGFVTDVFGLVLILPVTRPLVRRFLQAWLAKRATTYVIGGAGSHGTGRPTVVPGEIVDE
ncbi:MAG TPA: FxsA family protein [Nocardioidaceae bacterium]|nr:FxsA family protein [Nocardioidaceae bacterium]